MERESGRCKRGKEDKQTRGDKRGKADSTRNRKELVYSR